MIVPSLLPDIKLLDFFMKFKVNTVFLCSFKFYICFSTPYVNSNTLIYDLAPATNVEESLLRAIAKHISFYENE